MSNIVVCIASCLLALESCLFWITDRGQYLSVLHSHAIIGHISILECSQSMDTGCIQRVTLKGALSYAENPELLAHCDHQVYFIDMASLIDQDFIKLYACSACVNRDFITFYHMLNSCSPCYILPH
jgi:hypothetical protein